MVQASSAEKGGAARSAPSVATAMACVSPRVKRALPCVLGSRPALDLMGRTSVLPRPSARNPSSNNRRRMTDDSTACMFRSAKVSCERWQYIF